jgi:hypothetical protein
LQARLQDAGTTFRAEQDRQQFAGAPQRATVDLFGQLLMPVLQQPVADAVKATDVFFHDVAGPNVPVAPRLTSLVDLLLSPPRERELLGMPLPEPKLAPLPDPDEFSPETWHRAETMLAAVDAPQRLSGLLREARTTDGDLPRLVALRTLYAVSPPVGVALRQGDDSLLVAVDDGAPLADPEFGGADLLVGLARVQRVQRTDTAAGGGTDG